MVPIETINLQLHSLYIYWFDHQHHKFIKPHGISNAQSMHFKVVQSLDYRRLYSSSLLSTPHLKLYQDTRQTARQWDIVYYTNGACYVCI